MTNQLHNMRLPRWARDRALEMTADNRIGWDVFVGPGRDARVVGIRRGVAWVLRNTNGPGNVSMSLPEIAYVMGRGNHTSVITMLQSARLAMEKPPCARSDSERLTCGIIDKWASVYRNYMPMSVEKAGTAQ